MMIMHDVINDIATSNRQFAVKMVFIAHVGTLNVWTMTVQFYFVMKI